MYCGSQTSVNLQPHGCVWEPQFPFAHLTYCSIHSGSSQSRSRRMMFGASAHAAWYCLAFWLQTNQLSSFRSATPRWLMRLPLLLTSSRFGWHWLILRRLVTIRVDHGFDRMEKAIRVQTALTFVQAMSILLAPCSVLMSI